MTAYAMTDEGEGPDKKVPVTIKKKRRPVGLDALEKPGPLRAEIKLRLQTNQARLLASGRGGDKGRPMIVGLTLFGARLRTVWLQALSDDPYADWWMIKVEQALEQAGKELAQYRRRIDEILAGSRIDIVPVRSSEPVELELVFVSPHAFRGASLLADYDELVCALLTARKVGLLEGEESERLIRESGRCIRRVFTSAMGYRETGVTRQDLVEETGKAREAHEAMGPIPAEIARGERYPRLGPGRRKAGSRAERADGEGSQDDL